MVEYNYGGVTGVSVLKLFLFVCFNNTFIVI